MPLVQATPLQHSLELLHEPPGAAQAWQVPWWQMLEQQSLARLQEEPLSRQLVQTWLAQVPLQHSMNDWQELPPIRQPPPVVLLPAVPTAPGLFPLAEPWLVHQPTSA